MGGGGGALNPWVASGQPLVYSFVKALGKRKEANHMEGLH
jgi:hypothetical protein